MRISMIVAHGKNREIGKDNQLLWHISEDMKNFKRLTTNHCMVMGRKTFESIGRALPKRKTIILTNNSEYQAAAGCVIANSLQNAIDSVATHVDFAQEELFIAGGGEIYNLFLPVVDRIYLSEIDYSISADTFFPEVDFSSWTLTEQQDHPAIGGSAAWKFSVWDR